MRVLKSIGEALNVSAETLFEQSGLISPTRIWTMRRLCTRSGPTGASPKRNAAHCSVSTEAMLGTLAQKADSSRRWGTKLVCSQAD